MLHTNQFVCLENQHRDREKRFNRITCDKRLILLHTNRFVGSSRSGEALQTTS